MSAARSSAHAHRGAHVADRGSPALFSRLAAALAAWCVAFGLWLMSQGWLAGGAVALSLGLVALLATAGIALATGDDDPPVGDRASSGLRGLNHRRNGYGHGT